MNTTDKELTYTVTEKEYREGLAKGWTDDDMLKPGKYQVSPFALRCQTGRLSRKRSGFASR